MSFEAAHIKKLDEDVINRIAAGEVVQRPVNALKELIENSLDAKSTNIQITVKNGGLKLLQIQDNGTGIRKDNFQIVCERFTTSKLTEFEDLQKIATFGFRGEALASISHVAHLSITSKTKTDICAYQAEYSDGKLKSTPKPVAGNQGTIITVEDLFYNMKIRKQTLLSPAEEYQKISDLVSKYAVHNPRVGFALKKHGANNDIRTPNNSTCTENIRLIYGNNIARELIEFNLENDELQFKLSGYVTKVNYSHKKYNFVIFINNRLVDCQGLKKCIDTVYQIYLPKNTHPFVYLNLELNSYNVDVNVHPTKHEVNFLNESDIIDSITTALEQILLGCNSTKMFYTQTKLPNIQIETKETLKNNARADNAVEPNYMVRTDSATQKLETFYELKEDVKTNITKNKRKTLNTTLTEDEYQEYHQEFVKELEHFQDKLLDTSVHDNYKPASVDEYKVENEDMHISYETNRVMKIVDQEETANIVKTELVNDGTQTKSKAYVEKTKNDFLKKQEEKKCEQPLSIHLIRKVTRVDTGLTSVLQLRKNIEDNCHRTLRETFAQLVFVGSINPSQTLIQYNTQLLLCNTTVLLEEFFYQLILYNFQNFNCYSFEDVMSIKELALMGLNLPETGWTEDDGPKDDLAERISFILTEKGDMLKEYFSLEIDKQGILKTLPILLENYLPDPRGLPLYLIRLATEVNWETEKECFETFAQETAKFYAKVSDDENEFGKSWKWITEHVLYPALKEYFLPPKKFSKNAAILEVTSLPKLYQVFERC